MRAEAAAFERKTVFISIDAPAPSGPRELRRFVGEIVAFTSRGVFVRLLDGRGVDLPPDISAFHWASPGTYRLSGIPACVADPDVITAWTHHDDGGLSSTTPPPPLVDGEWNGPLQLLVGPQNDPSDECFDVLRARALTNKSVIIGVRYLDAGGEESARKQFFGRISRFTDEAATIELEDGALMHLPPIPHGFRWARPGCYTLRSCGTQVNDPDLVTRLVSRELANSTESELKLIAPDEPGDEGEIVA